MPERIGSQFRNKSLNITSQPTPTPPASGRGTQEPRIISPRLHSGPTYAGLRIGILGGSFNPAHAGHRAMSLFALKRLGLDQIWWLVSPQNPLKSVAGMAPLSKRLAMAQAEAQHPHITVTAMEAELGTLYTADTLKALQRRFPAAHFVWLMGADNLRQITRWRRWTDIFQSMPVAVFRRPAYAAGRGCGKAALRFDHAWLSPFRGQDFSGAAGSGMVDDG